MTPEKELQERLLMVCTRVAQAQQRFYEAETPDEMQAAQREREVALAEMLPLPNQIWRLRLDREVQQNEVKND